MAKVKIQGHASGSGVLTVTAPNTSTDRVITLPDATATIATTTDVAARLPSITDGGNATAITIDSSEQVQIASTLSKALNSGGWGLEIKDNTTGGGAGVGGAIAFTSLRADGGAFKPAAISGVKSNATGSNENGDLAFYTGTSGTLAEKMRITNDGRGLSQFTAKAWVNWNGTNTVSIYDSHNVSSIVDVAVGRHKITIGVDMANDDYAIVGSVSNSSRGNLAFGALAVGLVETYARESHTGDYTDYGSHSTVIFGD